MGGENEKILVLLEQIIFFMWEWYDPIFHKSFLKKYLNCPALDLVITVLPTLHNLFWEFIYF